MLSTFYHYCYYYYCTFMSYLAIDSTGISRVLEIIPEILNNSSKILLKSIISLDNIIGISGLYV